MSGGSSGGGGGTNTVTSTSQPPQAYLDAYKRVSDKAANVASTPYQQYGGNLQAGLSPDQLAGIAGVQNAQGAATPYINAAAQEIGQSTTPLLPTYTPYANVAQGYYQEAATPITPDQFSGSAVRQYESPYTQDVVDATQRQFNNANEIQQQGIVGNAISQGAWGGDRSAVAQGIVAGQQQQAQAPVIAGLENQGYSQALDEFNKQQTTKIGAQQAGQQLALGSGQGVAGLGATSLGAAQANNWLASQAGFGLANLGQQAQNSQLTGANALLSTGGLEQQQAQTGLNIPYQQWQAAQAYPFQTTGWEAGIAEGLGGAAGGSSSTTSPSASVGSQVAGAGLAGTGILANTGAFGKNGYLSNLFGSSGSDAAFNGTSPYFSYGAGGYYGDGPFKARGGRVEARAGGGGITGGNVLPFPHMRAPPRTGLGTGMRPPSVRGTGIANDNSFHPMKLASGGSFISPNGVSIPLLADSGGGGSGITSQPVSDYLSAVAATASHAQPQVYTPPPPPPPPSNPTGDGGGTSGDGSGIAPYLGTYGGGSEGYQGGGSDTNPAPDPASSSGGSGGSGGVGTSGGGIGSGSDGSMTGKPGSVNATGAQIGGFLGSLAGGVFGSPLGPIGGALGSKGGQYAGAMLGNEISPASRSMGIDYNTQSPAPTGIDFQTAQPSNPGSMISGAKDFFAAGTPVGPAAPTTTSFFDDNAPGPQAPMGNPDEYGPPAELAGPAGPVGPSASANDYGPQMSDFTGGQDISGGQDTSGGGGGSGSQSEAGSGPESESGGGQNSAGGIVRRAMRRDVGGGIVTGVNGGDDLSAGQGDAPLRMASLTSPTASDAGSAPYSPAFVDRVFSAESGKPHDPNPRSTADGYGQFLNGTWLEQVHKNNPPWAQGKTDEQILAMRADRAANVDMTKAYARENAGLLKAAGLPVTDSTLLLAQHFGGGGAQTLLRADPSARASDVLPANVIAANPDLANKTVGQVIAGGGGSISGVGPSASLSGGPPRPPPQPESAGTGIMPTYTPPPHESNWGNALLYAGLGIMGGKSPNALSNIGSGALQGLEVAANQKRADQAQASNEAYRSYESQAFGVREGESMRHNRATESEAAERLFQSSLDARARIAQEDKRLSQSDRQHTDTISVQRDRLNQEREHQQALEGQGRWFAGYGPGQNGEQVSGTYFAPKDGSAPVFHEGVNTAQTENIAVRKSALDATIRQRGIGNDQKERALLEAQISHMDNDAIRIYVGSKDPITGKFGMTPDQAQEQALKLRGKSTGAATPATPGATTPAKPATPAVPAVPGGKPPLDSILFGTD